MPLIAWGVELENLTEAGRVARLRPYALGGGSFFGLYSEEWFLLNAYSEEGKKAPFMLLLTLPFYPLVIFNQHLVMAELDYKRRRMREYMTGAELGYQVLQVGILFNLWSWSSQSIWWSGLAIELEKLSGKLHIGLYTAPWHKKYMALPRLLVPFLL